MNSTFNRITSLTKSIFDGKLSTDLAWSMGSFSILAVSGIAINIVITMTRDAAALGVFNIAYAMYIVLSQFAVWGIQYSVLRHTTQLENAKEEQSTMFFTAISIALITGSSIAIICQLSKEHFEIAFGSADTASSISIAALGLCIFPINKIILSYLNGKRRMKAFSILQGIRYTSIFFAVLIIATSNRKSEQLAAAFVIAESITLFGNIYYLVSRHLLSAPSFSQVWAKIHLKFGTKGFFAGMFTEVNSRIDIILIGLLFPDKATGIYSFAAMLGDGLYQILAVVRTNFNPVLAGMNRNEPHLEAIKLRAMAKKYIPPITIAISIALCAAYYTIATWIIPGKELIDGLPSLVIILTGLCLVSSLIPFDQLMVVTGHPAQQTFQQFAALLSNAVAAIILLQIIGIEGAATGTALSYVFGAFILTRYSKSLLNWNLNKNKFIDQ